MRARKGADYSDHQGDVRVMDNDSWLWLLSLLLIRWMLSRESRGPMQSTWGHSLWRVRKKLWSANLVLWNAQFLNLTIVFWQEIQAVDGACGAASAFLVALLYSANLGESWRNKKHGILFWYMCQNYTQYATRKYYCILHFCGCICVAP